ncbi:RlpA-like protein precursor [Kingella potus]|uniref:Endolytic peptidoglycan transglycosylase RlpA n=1 Tax=Kingella potus TaxID=265175 RepID=A0A377R2D5_9NEIS|nr:septal ring lytic transglycosylase RlpA family protein [Kingella potus]STR02419.1 RlpA-like protein precursor [Kingella potus]
MIQTKNTLFAGIFASLTLSACAAQQQPAAPAAETAPPAAAAPRAAAAAASAAQQAAAAPAAKKSSASQTAAKKNTKADRAAKSDKAKSDKAAKFSQTGKASWYGPGFHGRKTANGERFDMNTLTAAHRTLPISSRVRVTNLANGKSVVVRINDRGPYHGNRVLDLSKAAAQELGFIRTGTAQVKIEQIAADGKTIRQQNRRNGIVTDAKKKGQTPI